MNIYWNKWFKFTARGTKANEIKFVTLVTRVRATIKILLTRTHTHTHRHMNVNSPPVRSGQWPRQLRRGAGDVPWPPRGSPYRCTSDTPSDRVQAGRWWRSRSRDRWGRDRNTRCWDSAGSRPARRRSARNRGSSAWRSGPAATRPRLSAASSRRKWRRYSTCHPRRERTPWCRLCCASPASCPSTLFAASADDAISLGRGICVSRVYYTRCSLACNRDNR